jgi:hypothetical protein
MKELLKSLFLVLGGVCLLGTGGWFAVDSICFLERSHRAPGVVVRVVAKRSARATLYHPVVRYHPVDHPTVEFTAGPGLWQSLFEVGGRLEVGYRHTDPANARVVSFWTMWLLPIATALFGAACLFAGWHNFKRRAS